MHIVQYYHKPLPVIEYGGVERIIVWLIRGLRELGHKVTLMGPEGSAVDCNLVTVPFSSPVPSNSQLINYIPVDSDLIHFHSDGYLDMRLDIPVVNTLHGYRNNNAATRSLIDQKSCFLSDSHRREWHLPQNPFVYNGLDPAEFTFRDKKDDYYLFLSRIDWKVKGLDWAIDAAKRAGVKLIIAGNFHRKSFVNSYWRFPLKRKLGKDCYYVGPIGGQLKAALLAGAKALISPTKWQEPFGVVAIEALASGTPVITTHNGALPEIIEHGKQGYLCDSVEKMVESMKNIQDINSEECLKRINNKFHYKKMAQEYLKFYQNVL